MDNHLYPTDSEVIDALPATAEEVFVKITRARKEKGEAPPHIGLVLKRLQQGTARREFHRDEEKRYHAS